MSSEKEEIRIGRRVTWVGFWANVALSVFKVLAGIVGRSSAMVADGIHSASDLLTDVVVLIVIGKSRRHPDSSHSYGHGKIETFASFIISLLLAAVSVGIFVDGLERVIDACHGTVIPQPGWIALIMAIISIGVKEWLFRYTRSAARKISSAAMEANAWHHRSDSLSSFATLVGIGGAMFFGVKWRVLDPIAAMAVSVLIVIMSYKLAVGAVKELLEASLPDDITDQMKEIINGTKGVVGFHNFQSRQNGSRYLVNVHIKMSPDLSLVEAHDIATDVEHRLRRAFPHISVVVHMEPESR